MPRVPVSLLCLLSLCACAESVQGVPASLAIPTDAAPSADAADSALAAAPPVAPLARVPSKAFLTGETPTGEGYVALVRGERVTERDWDRARCGRIPASGICAKVTVRNMVAGKRLEDLYVELTRLEPRAPTPSTTRVTFRSDVAADPALGTSDAIGLRSYPPLGPAGAADDRADLYWVFESETPGPLLFHFSAVVKARLVDEPTR